MSELHTKRPIYVVKPALPQTENLSFADTAVAVFQAMIVAGVSEAKAECPFCGGNLHAGRFGNAQRAKVECDTCGRMVVESFRSAMGLPER